MRRLLTSTALLLVLSCESHGQSPPNGGGGNVPNTAPSTIIGGSTIVDGIIANHLIANIGGVAGDSGISVSGGSLGTIGSPTSMWVADGAGVMTAPRVFVGAAAAANTGNYNGVAPYNNDWVSQLYTGLPYTNLAQFASFSTIGGIGGLFATRTSDSNSSTHFPQNMFSSIALAAILYNDGTTNVNRTGEALYLEGVRAVSAASVTIAAEMDTVNLAAPVNMSPYTPLDLSVNIDVALGLAAGGSRPGAVNSSAAMLITGNGAAFLNGIEVLVGSVVADSAGISEAVAMPSGYGFRWWSGIGQPTGFIYSVQTTNTAGIVFTDFATFIGNVPGIVAGGLIVENVPSEVNGVTVIPATTGNSPTVGVLGTDTNINLTLAAKGSGSVILNGVAYGSGPLTNTVPVVTSANTVTYETVPNAALANSSLTIAGHLVTLGGTQALACADLSNGATGCSTATGTSGATIPLNNGGFTQSGTANHTGAFQINGNVITWPAAAITVARIDAAQTFAGTQTFSGIQNWTNATDATSTSAAGVVGSGGAAFAKSMFIGGPTLSVGAASPLTSAGFSFLTLNGPSGSGFSMQAGGVEQGRLQAITGAMIFNATGALVLEAGGLLGVQIYSSGGTVIGLTAPADPGGNNFTVAGVVRGNGGFSANGSAGLSTVCTETVGNTLTFTNGILTTKGANCT